MLCAERVFKNLILWMAFPCAISHSSRSSILQQRKKQTTEISSESNLRNKIYSFNVSEEGGKMAAQEKKKKNRQPEYTSESRRHLKDNSSKREMCVLIVAIC